MVKSNYRNNIINLKLENFFFDNLKYTYIGLNYLSIFSNLFKFLKKQKKINIYFLDLISCYKGWRHNFRLPVRNQRTWTNAKTTFSNNSIMRDQKLFLLKKYYGSLNVLFLSDVLNIEILNFFWKVQWNDEWVDLKKKRLKMIKKNPWLVKKLLKSKKYTSLNLKNNLLFIGYEPEFTKIFL